MSWRAAALAPLGVLLGAALWVLTLKIPAPFVLIGPEAAAAGLATGLAMRLGKGPVWGAAALSVLSVVLGRYAFWVDRTAKLKLASGEWIPPALLDSRTLGYYARANLVPTKPWDIAIVGAALAIAGFVAWRCAARD